MRLILASLIASVQADDPPYLGEVPYGQEVVDALGRMETNTDIKTIDTIPTSKTYGKLTFEY